VDQSYEEPNNIARTLIAKLTPKTWAISGDLALVAFRWIVVSCQAATLLITWPLWQVHTVTPMLPVLPLPYFDMGLILLLSLGVIIVAPRTGIIAHTILMIYALLIDQTRLQPEVVSLLFLMWGTFPNPSAKLLGRSHLLAMWLFAGFNKLLSPGFMLGTAQWMLQGLIRNPPTWLDQNFGYVIVLAESGTGLLALFPRTRKLAGLTAFMLHIGILLDLSPVGHNWNQAVWPWNVALAFAGFALIAPWKESLFQDWKKQRWLVRLLVIYILIAPAGFYFGITDAYLAHNLYTSNTASASTSGGLVSPNITWSVYNVPFPPEHRLFEQMFNLTCRPGDEMYIGDLRWWFRIQGLDQRTLTCPRS
jgi:hypothetical protein